MNTKKLKIIYWISVYSVQNLKFAEHRKYYVFSFQNIYFAAHFAALLILPRGWGRTTRPPPPSYAHECK
jgi:hypothetical protein